jgi:hypothetical protein
MSLRLLLAALQSGKAVNSMNSLIQVVHECVEEFGALEKREDLEVEALKEMIHRLEERSNVRVMEMEHDLRNEIDVLAKAMEVGGLTVGHLGVGMS